MKPVLDVFKKMFPKGARLHEPFFGGKEAEYVQECIATGWVSSVGKFVDRFESDLAGIFQLKSAVAIVNGTSALHISLKALGVEAGDEVLVPALTFVAPANAIAHTGAVPHFVDCEARTLGVDAAKLDAWLGEIGEIRKDGCFNRKTGRRIKALVTVHVFGHPVDLEAVARVCGTHRLELIEDAAEALGTLYKEKPVGRWGRLTTLSFNGNKTVTTGGGGAVLTDDEALGKRIKHLTTTAKVAHPWRFDHDEIGYNYRMPNLNAALGCAQLEQLPEFLRKKRKLAERYETEFAPVEGLRFFKEPDFAKSNYWLNVLILEKNRAAELENLLRVTNEAGYMTRPAWTLLSDLPMFRQSPKMDLSCARDIVQRLINIPSSVFL